MEEETKLWQELDALRREHQQLDNIIHLMEAGTNTDQFAIRKHKKRKLWLRDRILLLEKILYPDIIA